VRTLEWKNKEGVGTVQLVEHYRIDRHDPRFAQIDVTSFASKNLYNSALYVMRQQDITDETIISYSDLD
jgi:hypothetical protein